MTGLEIAAIATAVTAVFGYLRFKAYLHWLRKLPKEDLAQMARMIDAYRDGTLPRTLAVVAKVLVAWLSRRDQSQDEIDPATSEDCGPPMRDIPAPKRIDGNARQNASGKP